MYELQTLEADTLIQELVKSDTGNIHFLVPIHHIHNHSTVFHTVEIH